MAYVPKIRKIKRSYHTSIADIAVERTRFQQLQVIYVLIIA